MSFLSRLFCCRQSVSYEVKPNNHQRGDTNISLVEALRSDNKHDEKLPEPAIVPRRKSLFHSSPVRVSPALEERKDPIDPEHLELRREESLVPSPLPSPLAGSTLRSADSPASFASPLSSEGSPNSSPRAIRRSSWAVIGNDTEGQPSKTR